MEYACDLDVLCNTNLSPPVVQTVKLTTCGYLLNVLNICETRKDVWNALFSGQNKITRDQVGVSLKHQTYCVKLARVYQIVLIQCALTANHNLRNVFIILSVLIYRSENQS